MKRKSTEVKELLAQSRKDAETQKDYLLSLLPLRLPASAPKSL
jgi:hypothetical protein